MESTARKYALTSADYYHFDILTCMQAIRRDHSRVDESFAALLHEHLRGSQDSGLKDLREALRSDPVGKPVFADDLEKMIKEGMLW